MQLAEGCQINKSHSFLILSVAFQPCTAFFPFLVLCAVAFCVKKKLLYIVEEKLRNVNEIFVILQNTELII